MPLEREASPRGREVFHIERDDLGRFSTEDVPLLVLLGFRPVIEGPPVFGGVLARDALGHVRRDAADDFDRALAEQSACPDLRAERYARVSSQVLCPVGALT